jgi:hypothetical protein
MITALKLDAIAIGLMVTAMKPMDGAMRLVVAAMTLMVMALRLMGMAMKLMAAVVRLMVAAMPLIPAAMTVIPGPMTLVLAAARPLPAAMSLTIAAMSLTIAAMKLTIAAMSLTIAPMKLTTAPMSLMPRPMSLIPAILRLPCTTLPLASPCAAPMAPPDSSRRPRFPLTDGTFDDDDAPISEPRPSSPAVDAGFLEKPPPANDDGAPLPPDSAPVAGDDAGIPVTRELTMAFLAKKATMDRIREVIDARAPKTMQEADRKDIFQKANLRAMETTALAKSVPGMRPWVSRIAQNEVIDHLRGQVTHLRWLKPGVDVQELPPDPATEGEEAEVPADDATAPPRPIEEMSPRMIGPWLIASLETKGEKLTLEMWKHKAASGATNAVVAAEFGMTEAAFDQRIARFKAKWIPRWKKHKREQALFVALILLFLGGLFGWFFHGPTREEARPTAVPVLSAAPTPSVVPPEQFNNADPTQPPPSEEDGKKPRLKP